MSILETDYLIVGAGASGLAFADTLLTESPEASISIVDDRPRPGGHWIDAYDFVRLHQPSAFYGVNSLPLGRDRVETDGLNAGYHELATGTEVCAYFDEVMRRVLLPSGRVHYFPSSRYDLERRTIASVGAVTPVRARTTVDATYVAGEIPARHTPSYTIAPGVRHGPVNDLSRAEARAEGYVVIGAGKTGIDACLYLLERGTPLFLQGTINSFAWMREPAIVRWLAGARLNGMRGLLRPSDQLAPSQSAARTRIQTATSGAVANLRRLLAPPAQPASRP